MKYEYNRSMITNKSDIVKPFIRTMMKLDKIQEVIGFCNSIDDDEVIIQLEGKQIRLIQQMCHQYKILYGVEAKYSIDEVANSGDRIFNLSQENINSIQEQIIEG